MKKMLVIYYSWSNGNTKKIAEKLAQAKGADIARIETVKPYKGTHEEVVEEGLKEVKEHYLPELKPLNVKLNDYEEIAIGTPTWWYTMAPAVRSFLTDNDFTGKKVIPFMTNGGWPGHVIKDMISLLKGAEIINPKEIQFDSEGKDHQVTTDREVEEWINSIK